MAPIQNLSNQMKVVQSRIVRPQRKIFVVKSRVENGALLKILNKNYHACNDIVQVVDETELNEMNSSPLPMESDIDDSFNSLTVSKPDPESFRTVRRLSSEFQSKEMFLLDPVNKSDSFQSKYFRHLLLGIRSSYLSGVAPYRFQKWDKILYNSGKFRKCFCYAQYTLYTSYVCRILLLWLISLKMEIQNSPKQILLQYLVCAYSIMWVMQWNYFLHYGEHHTIINATMRLYQDIKRSMGQRGSTQFSKTKQNSVSAASKLSRFLSTVRIGGICVTLINLTSLIRKPQLKHLATSIFYDPQKRISWTFLAVAGVEFSIFANQWITIYANMSQISAYLHLVLECINILRPKKHHSKFHQTRPNEQDFYKEFQKLWILQNYFDYLYSNFIVHLEVSLILTVVMGFYAGVRVDGVQGMRPLFGAVTGLAMLIFVWVKMAQVYEQSTSLIQEWKSRRISMRSWFSKFLHSTIPIRIRLGNFFYADRGLILTILAIIINNTATLLLAK